MEIVVGISDLKVATADDILVTYALGSCVGICLWDATARVAGLSHIMLPVSAQSPSDPNRMKYADTAIPDLLRQMEMRGAMRTRIKAKIAGGAAMFAVTATGPNNAIWQIGNRNVASVQETLQKMRLPIVAKDVYDSYGRTVFFSPQTGIMTVKAVNKPNKDL